MKRTTEPRRMYLVDPKRIPEARSLLPPADDAFEGRGKAIDGDGAPRTSEVRSVEERLRALDAEMEQILRNRTLDAREKLRLYLETLRRHIMTTQRLNRLVQSDAPPPPLRVIDNVEPRGPTASAAAKDEKVPPLPRAAPETVAVVPQKRTPSTAAVSAKPIVETPVPAETRVPESAEQPSAAQKDEIEDSGADEGEDQHLAKIVSEDLRMPARATKPGFRPIDILRHAGKQKRVPMVNVMNAMADGRKFNNETLDWDQDTGELIYNGQPQPGTDIGRLLHWLFRTGHASQAMKMDAAPKFYDIFKYVLHQDTALKNERGKVLRAHHQEHLIGKGAGRRGRGDRFPWLRY